MATFRKRGDVWQVQVFRCGVRKSASFRRKAEAAAWAAELEAEILAGVRGLVPDRPVSALFERYRDEVSIRKRGERWERMRLGVFLRDPLADVRLPVLSASDIARWRDRRLAQVSAASVLREWNLLCNVFSVSVREWRMLRENPCVGVSRPKAPLPRDRRISQAELDRLLHACGYTLGGVPDTVMARVGAAMMFAIETAMRASEICGLNWSDVSGSVAKLHLTKNGTARSVPLSPVARLILDAMPQDTASVFGLKTSQVDSLFRKAKRLALVENLHFHDTRHEAITRLARKLDVLDLARMVGIRDLRILMVYYNARPDEIAQRLASADGVG